MKTSEERSRLLIHSARGWKREALIGESTFAQIVAASPLESKANGMIVQAVFFVLTCFALGSLWGFISLVGIPKPGVPTGILAILLAEVLIRQARLSATGVEAALWVGGLLSLITSLPSSGAKEAILLVAAAIGVAGARVRNPLLGCIAVIVTLVYFEEKFDVGTVAALAVAIAAGAMVLRTWERVSTELFWSFLTIAMPVTAAAFGDVVWRSLTIPLLAVLGLALLVAASRRPHHALFIGGGAALCASGVLLAVEMKLPEELELFLGGALLLGVSWGVAHALRGKTHGIISTPEPRPEPALLDAVGAGIAGQITAPDAPVVEDARPEGEGGFGGAGATGQY